MRTTFLSEAFGLLVPPACRSCGGEPPFAVDVLCPACKAQLPLLAQPTCHRCAQPLPCAPCPAEGSPWDGAVSACAHEGAAQGLVRSLKQTGSARVAMFMAHQMLAACPSGVLHEATIVAVPPHPARRRASGVDHSRVLAAAIGRLARLALARPLLRGGPPRQQAGATRKERLSDGRIIVRAIGHSPEKVILVDDVHTTGATFAACAQALRTQGCKSLTCISFARAI